jgi:hypothetical protein
VANFVFNIAKGRVAHYCTLPAANDALLVVPVETTGIEADDVLNNYDNLGALLAATNNEQTTMNRKTGITASVTVTVDDTNNWVDVDMPDQTWVAATGNAISALLICYDGDTTSGADTDVIPLTKHDFSVTPDGSDVIAQIASSGFYRAS